MCCASHTRCIGKTLLRNKDTSLLDLAKKPGYGFGQGDKLGVAGFGHHAGFKLAISEGGIFKIDLVSSRVDGRRMSSNAHYKETQVLDKEWPTRNSSRTI